MPELLKDELDAGGCKLLVPLVATRPAASEVGGAIHGPGQVDQQIGRCTRAIEVRGKRDLAYVDADGRCKGTNGNLVELYEDVCLDADKLAHEWHDVVKELRTSVSLLNRA